MSNQKPILHIVFPRKASCAGNYILNIKLAKYIKKRYSDDYNVIISVDGFEFIPDNSTVVKLSLADYDNFEKLIEYIDNIPSLNKSFGIKTTFEIVDDKDKVVTSTLDGDEINIESNGFVIDGKAPISVKTGIKYEPGTNIPEAYASLKFHLSPWNGLIDIRENDNNDGFESFIIGKDNIKSFITALEDIAATLRDKLLSGGESNVTQEQQNTMDECE